MQQDADITLYYDARKHKIKIHYSLAFPPLDAVSTDIPATPSREQEIRSGREARKMSPCGDSLKGRRVLALNYGALRKFVVLLG